MTREESSLGASALHLLEFSGDDLLSLALDKSGQFGWLVLGVWHADKRVGEGGERGEKAIQFLAGVGGIDRCDESGVVVRASGVGAGIGGREGVELLHLSKESVESSDLLRSKDRLGAEAGKSIVEVVDTEGKVGGSSVDLRPSIGGSRSGRFFSDAANDDVDLEPFVAPNIVGFESDRRGVSSDSMLFQTGSDWIDRSA